MPQSRTVDKQEEHNHVWRFDNYSESRCVNPADGQKCKWIRVGAEEEQRRKDEWNNYFQMVRHSKSYNQFKYMRAAWLKEHNKPKVRHIREDLVSLRCKPNGTDFVNESKYDFKEEEYMSKPSFPDPKTWTYYQVEGAS